jgi:hypothetical protein
MIIEIYETLKECRGELLNLAKLNKIKNTNEVQTKYYLNYIVPRIENILAELKTDYYAEIRKK